MMGRDRKMNTKMVGDLKLGPLHLAEPGLLQRQVVLRFVAGHQPFATHLRIFGPKGEVDHCAGHYFALEQDAHQDFDERVKRGYY